MAKKKGQKLCPRGKAAAKAKFDVYPSAYANAYASKVCAGKVKALEARNEKILEVRNQLKKERLLSQVIHQVQ